MVLLRCKAVSPDLGSPLHAESACPTQEVFPKWLTFFLSGCIKHGQRRGKSLLLVMLMSPHVVMTAFKLPSAHKAHLCSTRDVSGTPCTLMARGHSGLGTAPGCVESIEMPCASLGPITSRKCHHFREQILEPCEHTNALFIFSSNTYS